MQLIIFACLGILAALYIIFIIFPSIIIGLKVFSSQELIDYNSYDYSQTYYKQYLTQIFKNITYLDNLPSEIISIDLPNGKKSECRFYKNEKEDKVIFFIHGYRAASIFSFSKQAKDLFESGYSIALLLDPDYNGKVGYGTIEKNWAISWSYYFAENNKKVVFYGSSMGSTSLAFATENLNQKSTCGLVFDCGFSSPYIQLARIGEKRKLPVALIMPYIKLMAKLVIGEEIQKSGCNSVSKSQKPMLFIHGKNDSVVPYEDSNTLFKCANGEKKIILIEGADHTLAYIVGGEETRTELLNFIKRSFTE